MRERERERDGEVGVGVSMKHEGKRQRKKERHQILLCALSQKSFLSSNIITSPGGQLVVPNSHKLCSVFAAQPVWPYLSHFLHVACALYSRTYIA